MLCYQYQRRHTLEPLKHQQQGREPLQLPQGASFLLGTITMLGGVVGTVPRRHRQAIARVSVSALVASLPLLYVSLLRPPPAALAGDTAFWFLMSNCVIAAIVATADDPGTLFFGSSNDDDRPRDSDDGHISCGQPVVPLVAGSNNNEPPTVVTMKGGGGVVQQEVALFSNPMDDLVASPFLVEAGRADDAANKPAAGTDLPTSRTHGSALRVQRGERRHETAAIEHDADQNYNTAVTAVEGHEEREEIVASRTAPAPDEAMIPVGNGKRAIGKADRALTAEPEAAEPEPRVVPPKLLTSKSLPDQEVQEEEAADEDVAAAHGKGGRLRRSATDGSKWVAEENEYYWQLSDEELNRRVEDFIARFNRQIEQEAGV